MKGFGNMGYGNGSLVSAGGGESPSLTDFSPIAGATITPYTPLEFTLLAPNGIAAVVVVVNYPELSLSEVAYDRGGLAGQFVGSSVTAVSNGLRFSLSRRSGWPSSPRIDVQGADSAGNPMPEQT